MEIYIINLNDVETVMSFVTMINKNGRRVYPVRRSSPF